MDHMNPYHLYRHGGAMHQPQAPGMGQGMNQGAGWMHGPGPYPQPMAFPGQPVQGPAWQNQQASLFNDRFLKGVLIGAAAAYVLTNEKIQHAAIKSVVKAWTLMQGGVEELKERFQDAEAEVRAQAADAE